MRLMRSAILAALLACLTACESNLVIESKPVIKKSMSDVCGSVHWKRGRYFEFDRESVNDVIVCDKDGRALIAIWYANPSPAETWSVCSGTTGSCYGEFVDRKSAETRAMSVAESIATGQELK